MLLASYYFYMCWNPTYALLILTSTSITYVCGILTDFFLQSFYRKLVLFLSLASNLSILFVFKYANFFLENLDKVLSACGVEIIQRRLDLLLPVGISFYTFQALSYAIDVYRKDIPAERNFIRYALFVSFFPQLVAGPIERSKNLLTQIQTMDRISLLQFERIRNGCLLMLWGFFEKMVIADRASILVNTVYNGYQNYGFIEIFIATILFAIQIYCDFGGYSHIAIGAAKVLGIDLMQNFQQPYFSESINQFWRRWHISLTSWFTDYLYIPLGGSRKGTKRKYLNTLIVFGVSGLWHGASWSFITWGMLHAIYKIVGDIKNNCTPPPRIHTPNCISRRIRKCIITFLLVDFAWIFFAANSMKDALKILRQMTSAVQKENIFSLGLNSQNLTVLFFSILLLFAVDFLREKKIPVLKRFMEQECWFRWGSCLVLLWMILLFGVYGPAYDTSTFIYFQF